MLDKGIITFCPELGVERIRNSLRVWQSARHGYQTRLLRPP